MVGHQDPREDLETRALHQLLKELHKGLAIRIALHDRLPPVTTCHDVIDRTCKLNPNLPSHTPEADYRPVLVKRFESTAIYTEMNVEALRQVFEDCHPGEKRWRERGA